MDGVVSYAEKWASLHKGMWTKFAKNENFVFQNNVKILLLGFFGWTFKAIEGHLTRYDFTIMILYT